MIDGTRLRRIEHEWGVSFEVWDGSNRVPLGAAEAVKYLGGTFTVDELNASIGVPEDTVTTERVQRNNRDVKD